MNDNFLAWLNQKYGSYIKAAVTQGKVHDYLGMVFDFRKKDNLIINMSKCIGMMVTDFEMKYSVLTGALKVIAKKNVCGSSEGKLLNTEMTSDFHTYVAKGLFASTKGRPDSWTVVLLMMTRVKEPRESG